MEWLLSNLVKHVELLEKLEERCLNSASVSVSTTLKNDSTEG